MYNKVKLFSCSLLFWINCYANPLDEITVSMVGVSFPDYDPLSPTDNVMINTLTVTGIIGSRVNVSLNCPRVTNGSRYMLNGAVRLRYNYYTDSTYKTIWGGSSCSAIASSSIPVTIGRSGSTQVPVYAKAPALQDVPVGTYNDNLTLSW